MTVATTIERRPPTDTGRCGEDAGYKRHHAAGEDPCEPCQVAHRQALRRYRARTGIPKITSADREAARRALPLTSGRLAGTQRRHLFRPLTHSQCAECWGWRDDPRHPVVGGPVVGR
ncbi:hypothetical protein ACH4T9_19890 [Micromonospora sp. NPDC020750]|uniref:hypothetical protein n=1 Tax=unclassified Micromonospora TaxID=2617518 RepID=UPI0037900A3D